MCLRPSWGPRALGGATGARAMCCRLQELLLRANIEEMRCAVPRSRGEPLTQVTPALLALRGLSAREGPSLCPFFSLSGLSSPSRAERSLGGQVQTHPQIHAGTRLHPSLRVFPDSHTEHLLFP